MVYFTVALMLLACCGETAHHQYAIGDTLHVWAGSVGPLSNPGERYPFTSLPYCKPSISSEEPKPQPPDSSLIRGGLIDSPLVLTPWILQFRQTTYNQSFCALQLDAGMEKQFCSAVQFDMVFELIVDELPVFGSLGFNYSNGSCTLFRRFHFIIEYNANRVVGLNLHLSDPVFTAHARNSTIRMYFDVDWNQSDIAFVNRHDLYLDRVFFESKVHWFSIINSFAVVVLFVGLVSAIVARTLKVDLDQYHVQEHWSSDDEDDGALPALAGSFRRGLSGGASGVSDVSNVASGLLLAETGWKLLSGDVFRAPPRLDLLCTAVGIGMQLNFLALLVISTTLAGSLYRSRGLTASLSLIGYFLTTGIAGYYSGGLYARYGGKQWIRCMVLTAVAFPALFISASVTVNLLSLLSPMSVQDDRAVTTAGAVVFAPYRLLVHVIFLWLLTGAPLALLGTLVGRAWRGTARDPCRVNPIPRPIHARRRVALVLMAGLPPFCTISVEVYFILASFWHYKIYYVFDLLLLVYLMLTSVVSCCSIVSTYWILSREDYRWPWISFLSGFSTALYLVVYLAYYGLVRTNISGLWQIFSFLVYSALGSLALGLACGATAFTASSVFVRHLFTRVKTD